MGGLGSRRWAWGDSGPEASWHLQSLLWQEAGWSSLGGGTGVLQAGDCRPQTVRGCGAEGARVSERFLGPEVGFWEEAGQE